MTTKDIVDCQLTYCTIREKANLPFQILKIDNDDKLMSNTDLTEKRFNEQKSLTVDRIVKNPFSIERLISTSDIRSFSRQTNA